MTRRLFFLLAASVLFLPSLMATEKVMADELQIEILNEGNGDVAAPGMKVTVHYEGRLTDGTVFDTSYSRGQPFGFTLGSGQVIRGWEEGVAGMKIGEKRRLTIPLNWAMANVAPVRSSRPMQRWFSTSS